MQNYYQLMIPRLNGEEIKKNFSRYRSLVRKGIAGFIIFGGELHTVRGYIKKLQDEAEIPLIIASDLERGLGQQLNGGTLFPPAMALAAAFRNGAGGKGSGAGLRLVCRSFKAVAGEAQYSGINTILAPVLDINTNPKNPIISTRAFGEEPDTVSLLGSAMITELQRNGIAACGKHFPGHGDTAVDSHSRLPVLKQSLRRLMQSELRPFMRAVEAGVCMIMLGHLSVPALDRSGTPVSLSKEAVRFIRRRMGYDGILITDAMNMGGIGKYPEDEASAMALDAGVDILLHPSDPAKTASYLAGRKIRIDTGRINRFREGLIRFSPPATPLFEQNRRLAVQLTDSAITLLPASMRLTGPPLLIILNDEEEKRCLPFSGKMRMLFPGLKVHMLVQGDKAAGIRKRNDEFMIVAVFSDTRAGKGGASSWLTRKIGHFADKSDLFVSFCSPYLLDDIGVAGRMFVYGDAVFAQEAAACMLKNLHENRIVRVPPNILPGR